MGRSRVVAACLLSAALAAGAAYARGSASTVKVLLATPKQEFVFIPAPARAKAGKVTFVATNKGKLDHELVVLRTNLAPGKLPVNKKKSKAVEIGRVGRTPLVKPGRTRRLTLNLAAGRYLLICNVPGHYQAGSRAGFRVG